MKAVKNVSFETVKEFVSHHLLANQLISMSERMLILR
jgi:hypothetical protein